jgi:hypothetical protein
MLHLPSKPLCRSFSDALLSMSNAVHVADKPFMDAIAAFPSSVERSTSALAALCFANSTFQH